MSEFASSVVKTYNETAGSSLTLSDVSATTKAIVRAGQGTDAAAGLGAPFGTSRVVDGTLVVGVRPTEWVVLGPAEAAVGVYRRDRQHGSCQQDRLHPQPCALSPHW